MKGKRILAAFLALVMVLSTTTVIFAKDWSGQQTFDDVGKKNWYHGYVENLATQGIAKGYGKTDQYRPENSLSREEAAKMIAEAAGLTASPAFKSALLDLDAVADWALPYVYALEEAGVLKGFGDTDEFRPKQPIERGHIAKMLVKAFGLEKGPLEVKLTDLDLVEKDPEVLAAIRILASNGIVSGFGTSNKYRPLDDIDRAAFAKIIAIAQATATVQKAEKDGATPEEIAQAKKLVGNLPDVEDKDTKKSLEGRLDDLEKEEEPEPGPGPVDPPVESDLTAYSEALDAVQEADYTETSWAAYQAIVAANVVTTANTQAEVNAATAAIIAAQEDLVKVSQLIFDINRINGEGNMSVELGKLGNAVFNALSDVQQVEVAKLFIISRDKTEASPTDKVIREEYDSLERISVKLTEAVKKYIILLSAVNDASNMKDMKAALQTIGSLFNLSVDDVMTRAVFDKKTVTEGYASVTEVIQAVVIAAIKPSWSVADPTVATSSEDGFPLSSHTGKTVYKVGITTAFIPELSEAAKTRKVNTQFSITGLPESGVSVYYPVVASSTPSTLTWTEYTGGENVFGMDNHPLKENNIGSGFVYVVVDNTIFGTVSASLQIKMVDSAAGWENVKYGEETHEITLNLEPVVNQTTGARYSTIGDAITDAQTDNTIILGGDSDITSALTINNKSLVLNLNGKEIKSNIKSTFNITNKGQLSIIDTSANSSGTISTSEDYLFKVDGGTLILDSGTYTSTSTWGEGGAYGGEFIHVEGSTESSVTRYSVVEIKEGATLEYTGTASSSGGYGINVGSTDNCAYGVYIEIQGKIKTNKGSSLYINGTVKKTTGNVPKIEVGDKADMEGMVYAAGYGHWTFEDGAKVEGPMALSIKSGKFTINGGDFKATGDYADPAATNNNGTEDTGATISITSNDRYAGNIDITINNGIFTSANGYALYEGIAQNNDQPAAQSSKVTNLAITAGTFNGSSAVGHDIHISNELGGALKLGNNITAQKGIYKPN